MFADRSRRGVDFFISRAHRGQTSQYSESFLFKCRGRYQLAKSSSNLWLWNTKNIKVTVVCVHSTKYESIIKELIISTCYGYRLGFNPYISAKRQLCSLPAVCDNQPFPDCTDGDSQKVLHSHGVKHLEMISDNTLQ